MAGFPAFQLPPPDADGRRFGISVLEQLEQFRRRLIRSAIGILVGMLIAVIVGLPVGLALLGAGVLGYSILSGPTQALTQIGLVLWDNGTNFVLVAVPLFILMGQIIFHAGLADHIFTLAQRLTARLPGGLGISTVMASAAFGAVTGSSVAAVTRPSRRPAPPARPRRARRR